MHAYYMHVAMKYHDGLLGALVHDVAHLLRLEIDRSVKQQNLTRVKWLALQEIYNEPRLKQSELAEKLGLGPAAVGRLVDRLEKRGFVKRHSDPGDRRAFLLTITRTATELLFELEDTASQLQTELLEGLSARELSSLSGGLKKLEKNLLRRASAFPLMLATCEVEETLELAAFAQLTGLL